MSRIRTSTIKYMYYLGLGSRVGPLRVKLGFGLGVG